MKQPNQTPETDRFDIIFHRLEEAKKDQDANFIIELDAASETNKTISLFR